MEIRVKSGEKLSVKQSLFYGFQSVLACNLFLGPIVLIGIFQMNVQQSAAFIGMTFLACGIATLIQSGFFLKMQVIQGVSFAALGAIVAVVMGGGWQTLVGAVIVSSIFIILLGALRIFSKFVRIFIPGLIAGTVIIVVGISLIPVTFSSVVNLPGNANVNFFLAGITFVLLLIFMRLGHMKNRFAKILSIGGIIYAIVIGTVIASFFGQVNLEPVKEAAWFALPKVLPYGAPKFDIASIIVFCVIMIVVMIESVGTWFTLTELSGEKVDEKRMDRGVVGEGIGVLIGSFFGGLPITSYASNTGVLVLTKVFSRYAAFGAGVIAVVMAFCPKLLYLIAVVPSSVIWGVYGIVAISVFMSGITSIKKYPSTERNNLIVGISVMMTIGVGLLPAAMVGAMPGVLSYFFQAPIAIGSITAIILNLVLRARPEDQAPEPEKVTEVQPEEVVQAAV
ncbi:uracil-xanthine permease family protein [Parasporobacterium paucivorans]|uniref:Nucleobase:cation symporter-2, NCS2 family n=1 Tax=Parasporobacterium paucivorans DSM 15970 TaxID=1122934 RepID=A0A1M6E302_9FIRM|nr:solute carrier family 23 protein [Parasporobacterium paucivorans]SHI79887.1 nucleobase:cation symporter-2, NCS2 family [Parasporobacterium paucivorans DSM 15970]